VIEARGHSELGAQSGRKNQPAFLSCLSGMLVYFGQTVGWIKSFFKTTLGMQVVLGPGHIVLDGDPAPLLQKGAVPPIFGPYLL